MDVEAALEETAQLKRHRDLFHEWAERTLDPYTNRLRGVAPQPKEFNDPIWGTLVLQPFELIILDSPLVQRLRRIRQLGVVHLVYAAAGHYRLEHSLGALHQVERLIVAINGSASKHTVPIDVEYANALRLTALCHDVGHGSMSHVSQNGLENLDECDVLRTEFGEIYGPEDPKLSEIVAYFLLTSSAFGRLVQRGLELCQTAGVHYVLPQNIGEWMGRAINGLKVNNEFPLMHELISGPFDADKLDYMPRDAFMSGVPVVTDINRLIRKVRAVQKPLDELPLAIARQAREGPQLFTIAAIARSGARTLDELAIGRTLLFDKIYRHQKVRAAETMVASILRELAAILPQPAVLTAFELVDDQLLDLDIERIRGLASAQGIELNESDLNRARVAEDIARRLRDRRLFVRATAFAEIMPEDPYATEQPQITGLQQLLAAAGEAEARGHLVNEIVEKVSAILSALGRDSLFENLPSRDARPYIWIDPPHTATRGLPGSDAGRAYLLLDNGEVVSFEDTQGNTRRWADAYLLTRDTGFVFTTAELAPYVHLATERVVRERYGVRLPASMASYTKQSDSALESLRRELGDVGWYSGAAYDLRPLPRRLEDGDVRRRLRAVARRLTGYEGPAADRTDPGRSTFDAGRMLDWLRQFEDDELIDAALHVLEHIRLFGRSDVDNTLVQFMSAHPEFRGGSLVPLGSAKDSGAVNVYYANDVAHELQLTPRSLLEALNTDAPIVFLDDLVGSGGQAAAILSGWLGEEPTDDLGEERDLVLQQPLGDALRQREIAFVFVTGLDEGLGRLEAETTRLGFSSVIVERNVSESELPSVLRDDMFESPVQARRFREAAAGIGRALLTDQGQDPSKVADRGLGYGDRGLLIVFPYNTPAHTLTCLWAAGAVSGVPWIPIFPRRKKR